MKHGSTKQCPECARRRAAQSRGGQARVKKGFASPLVQAAAQATRRKNAEQKERRLPASFEQYLALTDKEKIIMYQAEKRKGGAL